jgi:hypothetical protein
MTAATLVARTKASEGEFSGSKAVEEIRTTRQPQEATSGYIILGPTIGGSPDITTNIPWPTQVKSTSAARGSFYGGRLILAAKTPIWSGVVNASTLEARTLVSERSGGWKYAAGTLLVGEKTSMLAVPQLEDKRLQPLFDRIEAFQRGEWEPFRGEPPNERATENTLAVLRALSGGSLIPKRLLGSDGRLVLYFTTGEKYSNIEVANTGQMIAIKSNGQGAPQVRPFTLRTLTKVLEDVSAYLA